MTPARFRWGLLLIQLGIFLILANMDIVDEYFWEDLIVYFPFVLIAVGVEKIFTKSKLQILAYLTSVILFFGGLAIVYQTNYDGISDSFFSESKYSVEFDPNVERFKAVFNLGDTDLKIRDAGKDLFYGRFDKFTKKPKIKLDENDAVTTLELTRSTGSFLGGLIKIDIDEPSEWYVRLTDRVPVDLECFGENSYIHLNLATTYLENLLLDADDAELYVKLGDISPFINVKIYGRDSNLKLRLPQNVGVRITGLDKKNYLLKIGFTETDSGFFINQGYDTLNTKVEIDVDDKINNFVLDFF